MAKKDCAPMLCDKPEPPPTALMITKEQAKAFSIGKKVTVVIEGTVFGIQHDYGDSESYRLELKPSKVTDSKSGKNKADDEMERMKGEK